LTSIHLFTVEQLVGIAYTESGSKLSYIYTSLHSWALSRNNI